MARLVMLAMLCVTPAALADDGGPPVEQAVSDEETSGLGLESALAFALILVPLLRNLRNHAKPATE
ncbi:MAG: hypothetical protein AB7O24_13885 [Kofleriaceae bacterium]